MLYIRTSCIRYFWQPFWNKLLTRVKILLFRCCFFSKVLVDGNFDVGMLRRQRFKNKFPYASLPSHRQAELKPRSLRSRSEESYSSVRIRHESTMSTNSCSHRLTSAVVYSTLVFHRATLHSGQLSLLPSVGRK